MFAKYFMKCFGATELCYLHISREIYINNLVLGFPKINAS